MAKKSTTLKKAVSRIDPQIEQNNLGQKLRLLYLLRHYAPTHLRGIELFRRLRLSDVFDRTEENSETGFEKKTRDRGKRWLPNEIALRWITEGQFKQWMQIKGEPNYRPERGFEKRVCDALGFIIVDEFENWPRSAPDGEEFARKYQQVSEFIRTGVRPQPGEVFYDLRDVWAEEITHVSRATSASEEVCTSFLKGERTPQLGVVNANATIKRHVEERVLREIKDGDLRVILLTSAAGDGKSTLMYRLAQKLFDEGWRIFFKHERQFHTNMSWPIGQDKKTNTVLFIDRAEGLRDPHSLYSWVEENPQLRVVMAAREIDWTQRGLPLDANYHRHITLGPLGDDEINALGALMHTHGVVHPPVTLQELRLRLHRSVHESEHPYMLAAVMTASSGTDFGHVLTSMVTNFPYPKLMRWTALCAAASNSAGVPTNCTKRLFSALHCEDATDPIDHGAEKFETVHRRVRSEIILIHGDRYDLRHPDITRFALHHYYDAGADGVLRSVSKLEDDLYEVLRAVVRVRLHENYERFRRGLPDSYIYDIPRSWWSSPMAPTHEVGRQLYEDACGRLGSLNADRRLRANIIFNWMSLEYSVEATDPKAIEVQEKWLPALVDILSRSLSAVENSNSQEEKDISESLYKAYEWWLGFSIRHGRVGTLDAPEAGTTRAVFRTMWETHSGRYRGIRMLNWLIKNVTSAEQFGTLMAPQPYTVRWLFRQLLQDHERRSPTIGVNWAKLEAAKGNGGLADEPIDGSARWIFRECWKEPSLRSAELVIQWAALEVQERNLGDEDNPSDYTARWLFREAWKEASLRSVDLVIQWAAIESEEENLGDKGAPAAYTARWLFHEAWKEPSLRTPALAMHWAQVETQTENLGDIDHPDDYTVRWLLHNAWETGIRSSELMVQWARMEAHAHNLGDHDNPSIYSARWILRQAWKDLSLRSPQIPVMWVNVEAEAQNLGDYDNPAVYSARWVMREAWKDPSLRSAQLSLTWAHVETREQNVGDKSDPADYTVRWVLREAWTQPSLRSSNVAIAWAQIEADVGNIGENDNPADYTARWVLREAWTQPSLRSSSLVIAWAQIEANAGNVGENDNPADCTARWALREGWKVPGLRSTQLLTVWANIEAAAGNVGENDNPADYTARWALREGWKAPNLRSTQLLTVWAKIEAAAGNVGENDHPADYTVRWVLREGWKDPRLRSQLLIVSWAIAENEEGNLGDKDDPAKYSARWVLREGWNDFRLRSQQSLMTWVKMEAAAGNLGDKDDPAMYSARWVVREAWKKARLRSTQLPTVWAKIEAAAGNIGDDDAPADFTARWVLREAWKDSRLRSQSLIVLWATVETEAANLGDKDEPARYSARWLLREAWNDFYLRSQQSLMAWVKIEAAAGNLGDKDDPAMYSARWVLREVWKNTRLRYLQLLTYWAWLEIKNRNFDDCAMGTVPEYTAQWLVNLPQFDETYRQHLMAGIAAESGKIGDFHNPVFGTSRHTWRALLSAGHHFHLRDWARYELQTRDAPTSSEEFSAQWIFDQWQAAVGNLSGYDSIDKWLCGPIDDEGDG